MECEFASTLHVYVRGAYISIQYKICGPMFVCIHVFITVCIRRMHPRQLNICAHVFQF